MERTIGNQEMQLHLSEPEGTALHPVPYERMLRMLGSYLDDQSAHSITAVETTDGFTVQFIEEGSETTRRAHHFGYEELRLAAERREQQLIHRRKDRSDSAAPGSSYEDLLRALGHDMQKLPAYTVVLDELEDGFLVTYQCYEPLTGFMPRKRMAVFGAAERQLLLDTAHGRRRASQKRGVFQLLRTG